MSSDKDTPVLVGPVPEWASEVMLKSRPIPLFSWKRAWAQFRLNVHCGLKFHRPVTVKLGLQFFCGCSDCDFYPEPVENL